MSWSPEQYASYIKTVARRVFADHKKSVEGNALECPIPRKDPDHPRVKILFRVFAVYPTDWDGSTFKELQDGIVHAGLLDGDEWDRLECAGIVSEKAYSKEEERTEVEIFYP